MPLEHLAFLQEPEAVEGDDVALLGVIGEDADVGAVAVGF